MGLIESIFNQAQLSEAAYANFSLYENAQDALIAEGFSNSQAASFVTKWKFVNQYTAPSSGPIGSGFSATVFQNIATGQYVFSVRGTEASKASDLSADLYGIGGQGIALRQALDLYNYRKSLTATKDQPYQAAYLKVNLAETALLGMLWGSVAYYSYRNELQAKGYWVEKAMVSELALGDSRTVLKGSRLELGKGIPLTSGYDVVGHSLGGHLAMVLGRLDGANIASVETFNPPYFDPFTSSGLSDRFFTQLQQLLGGSGTSAFFPSTNYEVSGDVVHLIGATRAGTPKSIFTESEGITNPLSAHSVVPMTDSLAVSALFAQVAPSLDTDAGIQTISELLRASACISGDSLEAAVSAIGKIYGKAYDMHAGQNEREDLYKNLKELRGAITGTATIVSLVGKNFDDLLNLAKNDAIAYRYAIKEGNPFAVVGADYSALNSAGELNFYNPADGTGDLTDRYLTDRSKYLAWKIQSNLADKLVLDGSKYGYTEGVNYAFTDLPINQTILVTGTVSGTNKLIFGGEGADLLNSAGLVGSDDSQYGGSGTDILQGGTGSDYLEGGSGLDLYRFAVGDAANDVILDTDRRGLIQRDGKLLTLAYKRAEGQWTGDGFMAARSADGKDLVLTFTGQEKITIKDFDFAAASSGAGCLGLHFIDPLPTRPTPTRTYIGDTEDWDSDPARAGTQTVVDARGNVTRADGQDGRARIGQADRFDVFVGTSASNDIERFQTFGNTDRVYGDGANSAGGGIDFIELGEGRDFASGGGGNDWIEGDAGGDILTGNAGNDVIYAETSLGGTLDLQSAIQVGEQGLRANDTGDLLSGDDGNDILIGSFADDALLGGAGKDILIGRAGNDNLVGDDNLEDAWMTWTAKRTVLTENGVRNYRLTFEDVTTSFNAVTGEADVLIGGAGDDWALGGGGDDLILGGNGQDVLFGDAGSDILQGGQGNDVLVGDNFGNVPTNLEGNDILEGGEGDDQLDGNGGDDILIGGTGNDILSGGKGKDTYIFNKGDGVDTIWDTPATGKDPERSVLLLGEGVDRRNIKFGLGSLYVDIGGGEGIHFEDFNPDDPTATPVLSAIQFADGSVMTYDDILAQGFDLDGTAGDDTIWGTAVTDRMHGLGGNDILIAKGGDDMLEGGSGDDQLEGDGGNDTYVFNLGDGQDVVFDDGLGNTLRFGPGVTPESLRIHNTILWAEDLGANIPVTRIEYGPGDDSIVLRQQLASDAEHFLTPVVGTLQFDDGRTLTYDDILAQGFDLDGTDGNDVIAGTAVADRIHGSGGADRLLGKAGNDILDGGAGADNLEGGAGNDTYVFKLGDGQDLVIDTAEGANVIRFGEGIERASLSIFNAGYMDYSDPTAEYGYVRAIQVSYGTQGDYFFIKGGALGAIDHFEFADDTTFSWAEAISLLPPINIYGTEGIDRIIGTGHNDMLSGQGGADLLIGQGGNDVLEGGTGNDTLDGGNGDDRLDGGNGDDVLQGGLGSDYLNGKEGDDTYRFEVGDGLDMLTDIAGTDTVVFGAGLDPAALHAQITRYINGDTRLDIDFGGEDKLSIINGQLGNIERYRFADGSELDHAAVMARLNGAVIQGTANADILIGSPGADSLRGLNGDDTLKGQEGNDLLVGGAGNDLLDGGVGDDDLLGQVGNDLLQGGAGYDTYHLGLGMGADTVVEDGGDISRITLGAEFLAADIGAVRQGDDLRLIILGGQDGLLLKNYFNTPNLWVIDSGNGVVPVSDFLAQMGGGTSSGAIFENALAQYRRETQLNYYGDLAANGYVAEADGTWRKEQGNIGQSSGNTMTQIDEGIVTEIRADNNAQIYFSGTARDQIGYQSISTTQSVQNLRLSTSATHAAIGSGSGSDSMVFISAGSGINGVQIAFGSQSLAVTDPQGNYLGSWITPPEQGGAMSSLASQSGTVNTISYTTYASTYRYHLTDRQLNAGEGDNRISLNFGAVDAGAGNDIVTGSWGRPYLDGQNFWNHGNLLLYGNAGNDVLTGGWSNDILIGGTGADVLDGGDGSDRYLLESEAPLDLIIERGETGAIDNQSYSHKPAVYAVNASDRDVVFFPEGVAAADLHFSWDDELIVWPNRQYRGLGTENPPFENASTLTAVLIIRWGENNGVRIAMPHTDMAPGGIEIFRFADGSELARAQLLAMAPEYDLDPHLRDNIMEGHGVVVGDLGNDVITGGIGDDRIDGGDGDDVLSGGDGDDMLIGGRGYDRLDGGAGNDLLGRTGLEFWGAGNLYHGGIGNDRLLGTVNSDVYEFGLGDGRDVISDYYHDDWYQRTFGEYVDIYYGGRVYFDTVGAPADFNVYLDNQVKPYLGEDIIRFGAGIRPDDIQVVRDADDLSLRHVNGTDEMRITGWFNGQQRPVSSVEFADGSIWKVTPDGAFEKAQSTLSGTEGNDTLVGSDSDDSILGLAGDDRLSGNEGDDQLQGGIGNDILIGGAGDDAYIFNSGDGVDHIEDAAGVGAGNVLQFGPGITPDMLSLELGSLLIRIGNNGDAVHLEHFDPNDVFGPHAVDTFRFADGTTLSYEQLLARGFDLHGTASDDILTGTNTVDRIDGGAGDDTLYGGAGDDILDGSSGNDHLDGGAGNDVYRFGRGDGEDVVERRMTDETDVLRFKSGVSAGDMLVLRQGDDLVLSVVGTADSIRLVQGATENGIGRVEFADGTVWEREALLAHVPVPIVQTPVTDQSATEKAAFVFALPTDTFVDADPGAILTFSATQADGQPLPAWLHFDPAARTFSGTPENGDVGVVRLTVTATDAVGAMAASSFAVTVGNVNDAPVVLGESFSTNEDVVLTLSSAALLANDHDIDPTRNVLSISEVGNAAHGTVTIDANGQVSFVPEADYNGAAGFDYTVADDEGGFATASVSIDVLSVNDAPVAAISLTDQTAKTGTPFAYTLPPNAFTDIDAGDRLILTATLVGGQALPSWLAFDVTAGTFSGTPAGATNTFHVQVTATDLNGAAVSETFALAVVGNSPPVANLDTVSVTEDGQLYALGNVLTNDRDPDSGTVLRVGDPGFRQGAYGTLFLKADGGYSYLLNNWLPGVQVLGAGQQAVDRFAYRANDGTDETSGELAVTVSGANDKPLLFMPLEDRTLVKNSDVRWQLPAGSFVDIDRNDKLTYSAKQANGTALPTWLKFDATTQTFTGRVPANAKGSIDIQVTATDGHGANSSAFDTFSIRFDNPGSCHGNQGGGNSGNRPTPRQDGNPDDDAGSSSGHPGASDHDAKGGRPEWPWEARERGGEQNGGKFAYLDLRLMDRHDKDWALGNGARESADDQGDIFQRWAQMERALAEVATRRGQADWSHDNRGGDMRNLAFASASFIGSAHAFGGDAFSLSGGTNLKGFKGLQEGMKKIA